MKPKEITGLIVKRAAATKLNVKGFIDGSGMSFRTFKYLQSNEGGNSMMSSIVACLRLMDLAEVAHPERYLELDLPGEQVVAIRRADFLALMNGSVARIFEDEKNEAAGGALKSDGKRIEGGAVEKKPKVARVRGKSPRKGRRAIPRTGRCCSRGRSNRRVRDAGLSDCAACI